MTAEPRSPCDAATVKRLCSRIAIGERALSVLSREPEDEPVRRVLLAELDVARTHLALLTDARRDDDAATVH